MITAVMKRQMVVLLGQVIRDEGGEANWNAINFNEKMKFAESVLDSAVHKIECSWGVNVLGQEIE